MWHFGVRMIPFDADGNFRPRTGNHELRRLAVRGAAATFSASGLGLAIQIVSTVVLARLLTPADFGIVTMVTTFSLLVVSFGANGLTEAVIQFDEINHGTASNLFWLNSGAGLVLALAFASSGSLLAHFYQNPLVAKVAVGLSIGIFVQAISVIHLALLMRAMRFTGTSTNEVVGRIVYATIPIVLALRGWGYWALVSAIVAQQISITLGAWWLCRWIPSLPRRTGKTRTMLGYAGKVYAQFSVAYSTRNIDNLLVGWQFNAITLGFYKKAFDLFALTASQLTAPLNNVALAALSRLNQDHERFRRSLSNSLGMVAFIGMAASADLSLIGQDVVRLVLGAKWSESGRIFELFGPGIGAMLLYSTVGWVHLPIGKPGRWLRWSVTALAITVLLFLVSLHWGPMGVAAAWSISYWVLLVPAFWYAGRPIGFRASALVSAVWRYTAASLTAGLISAAIVRRTMLWGTPSSSGGAFVSICVISLLFGVLYLAAVILYHWGIAPLQQFAGLLRELIPSRKAPEGLEAKAVGE
jgi:PST family polysaccharide transporter